MDSEVEEFPTVSVLSPKNAFIILQLLIGYVDIFGLKTMRLVCKKTKEWVETAKLLRHFRVRITGPARLNAVLRAPIRVFWNSFIFTEKCHYISSSDIRHFVKAYGDQVRDLELDRCQWDNMRQAQENAVCLLLGCRKLESLHIGNWIFGPVNDDLARRLVENWRNMRHLHVDMLQTDPVTPLPEMTLFSDILSTCTQLKTLTLPNFAWVCMPDQNLKALHQRLLVDPLLAAVRRGRLRSLTLKYHGLFNYQIFRELATACLKTGTVLHNVPEKLLQNLAPEHLSVLDIIGDLHGVTDTMIRQPLTNVRSIRFGVDIYRPSTDLNNFHIGNNEYDMPPFSNLRDVEISFTDSQKVENQDNLELFLDRLARVRRPTVQSLRVVYTVVLRSLILALNISPVNLCASFVNLRVLHVEFWKGKDEEWLQLWPLVGHTLMELELHDCPNLTDHGIVGYDLNQPAFLQLKYLRKFSLKRPQLDQLTDVSFMQAFRYMPLRSFEFSVLDDGRRISGKTLKAMWKAPFGKAIQEFHLYEKNMMLERPPRWRRWWKKATKGLRS